MELCPVRITCYTPDQHVTGDICDVLWIIPQFSYTSGYMTRQSTSPRIYVLLLIMNRGKKESMYVVWSEGKPVTVLKATRSSMLAARGSTGSASVGPKPVNYTYNTPVPSSNPPQGGAGGLVTSGVTSPKSHPNGAPPGGKTSNHHQDHPRSGRLVEL